MVCLPTFPGFVWYMMVNVGKHTIHTPILWDKSPRVMCLRIGVLDFAALLQEIALVRSGRDEDPLEVWAKTWMDFCDVKRGICYEKM